MLNISPTTNLGNPSLNNDKTNLNFQLVSFCEIMESPLLRAGVAAAQRALSVVKTETSDGAKDGVKSEVKTEVKKEASPLVTCFNFIHYMFKLFCNSFWKGYMLL